MNRSRFLLASTCASAAILLLGHTSSAQANSKMPIPGLSATLSGAPPYTCKINYYVNATTGKDSNPGTQAQPWKTIQNADDGYPNTPVAGECVNVMPGTYNITSTLIFSHGGDMASSAGFVVYRSTVPGGAHIVAQSGIDSGGNGDMLMLWAPYLIFDGFNIDGNKALANGSGIDGCANGGGAGNIAHHFMAMNNTIHDMGGSGLSSCTADYITWWHNVVYNTSSTSLYQVSGINIWQPKALAPGSFKATRNDNRPFGIMISYNIAYNNGEGPSIPGNHTDGNGIIIDTTLGSSTCSTCGTPYPGNILVIGNSSYNNGGGGIHLFLSKNVTVANNTVYNNYTDTRNDGTARGDLSSGGSQNITWINNLAQAVPGAGSTSYNRPAVTFALSGFTDTGTWTNNLTYGANVSSDSGSYIDPATNLLGVAPKLTNPAGANFVPLAGSPAIASGQPASYIPCANPDIGAY
jgi:parallel beta-helix repeat protein